MFYSNFSPIRKSSISNGASKTIALAVGVLAMVFLLSYIVLAWTEPSTVPPQGNVSTPINVGNSPQGKSGRLLFGHDDPSNSWKNDSITGLNWPIPNNDAFLLTTGYTGSQISDLRLYIVDDDDDRFSIWGGTCSGGDCGDLNKAKNIMTIRGDGNVGIGTTDPGSYKLNVSGDANATRLCIAGVCQSSWPAAGTNYWTQSGSNLYPNNTGWNVGIGTTGPNTKLQVEGSVFIPSGQSYWIGNYTDSGDRLRMYQAGTHSYIDFATGNLNIRAGTATKVLIDSAGNVGIGITGPVYKLDVQGGDINASGVYRKGGTAGTSATCGTGNTPSGITISGGIVTSAGSCTAIGGGGIGGSISSSQVVFGTGANTIGGDNNLWWDNTNKRLGIGTTAAPLERLQVVGNIKLGGNEGNITGVNEIIGYDDLSLKSNSSGDALVNIHGSQLWFYSGGEEKWRVDLNGSLVSSSATGGTQLSIKNTGTGGRWWGFYSTGSGNAEGAGKFLLRDYTAGSVRMTIDTAGNVGIGTTSPAYKLDVNGTLNATGFRMSTGAGAGKVLTSDAEGLASWQTPAGESIMYLRCVNSYPYPGPASCPSGWTPVADYQLEYTSCQGKCNYVRTCYRTDKMCQVMYLRSIQTIESASCPSGWTPADYKYEFSGCTASGAYNVNNVRTCYKCY